MMKIIGLFPLTGNGGIASWTKKFLATFPNEEFVFKAISNSPSKPRGENDSMLKRMVTGLCDKRRVIRELKLLLRSEHFDLLHTTTSGSLGAFRDYSVAKICKKNNVKTILHCRYGCIPEDYQSIGLIGCLLRRSLSLFDQIWVLDNRTYNFLRTVETVKDRVFLTPNSIEVKEEIDTTPKNYKRIAFVGNLIPTKGLYELTEAVLQCNVRLDIIGPGTEGVIQRLIEISGEQMNKKIFIHGRLPNPEAVKFMHDVDIIALPTYYSSEAFPISILESMSLTKMVISCPRAAVPDMLTDLDGKLCGILVPEKSVQGIVDAINWCQTHKEKADVMCQKAYEKVKTCYSKEVVYEMYRNYYRQLL